MGKWKSEKTYVTLCSLDTEKEVDFASYSYREKKVDSFWESQAQKIMNKPRGTIHIERKIELLWQKDDSLCCSLVGTKMWENRSMNGSQ